MYNLKRDVDYKLVVPQDNTTQVYIELISGTFAGVIYSYGKVAVNEDVENDTASISFDYDVKESVGIEGLEENEDFKNHIGNVLVSMVMNQIEETPKEGE